MKTFRGKRLLSALLVTCMLLTLLPSVALAKDENADADLAAQIYGRTEIQTDDSDWVRHLKEIFAEVTGIDSADADDAVTWYPRRDMPTGVSAPWSGQPLAVTDSLPDTHTSGEKELVAVKESEVNGTVTTIYTSYTTSSDVGTLELKTVLKSGENAGVDEDKYYVYTGEALRYVMNLFGDQTLPEYKGQLYLEKDIDLNGCEWGYGRITQGQDIHGQGHTIYNLRAGTNDKNGRFGFVSASDSTVENNTVIDQLTFQTGYISRPDAADSKDDNGKTAIFAFLAGPFSMTDVHADNFVVAGGGNTAGLIGRSNSKGTNSVANCSIMNSVVFGNYHTASLSGCLFNTTCTNSFSVGCTVLSIGQHSGGLISCANNSTFDSCFTDVDLYGSVDTGVFIGIASGGTNSYTNCFASGFIEGTNAIGGFIGTVSDVNCIVNFADCYSTAMVGMRGGGTKLGGFIGQLRSDKEPKITLTDCYAAGEVGSTDTIVTGDASQYDQLQSTGGFIGYYNPYGTSHPALTNCYYDKQTTAMREWGIGEATVANPNLPIGVLTTDTVKAGTGLTNDPSGATEGFMGFSDDSMWDYSETGHYPELEVFKSPSASKWGDNESTIELVQAYSLASTSGMQLETWDKSLNTDTGKLTQQSTDETVYDTVRDIVNGFELTSNAVSKWDRIGSAESTDTKGKQVTILGTEYDVVSLKHQNGSWFCDDLQTGIEWLKVTTVVGGETATRRVRVIPTCAIDAGESRVITYTQDGSCLYDHADDVKLLFSTAQRMANSTETADNTYDVTTGIYPDRSDITNAAPTYSANALTEQQKALMEHNRSVTGDDAINTLFESSNDLFTDVDASYMSDGADNAKGGLLHAYVYEVTGFGLDGEILTATTPVDFGADNSQGANISTYGQQFNGYAKLPNSDKQYLVAYAWQLNDGRALMDAKLVRTAEVPFHVALNVYQDSIADANLYSGKASTYTGTETAPASIALTNGASSAADIDAYVDAAAAWKLTDAGDTIKSITLTLDFSGQTYSEVLPNPSVGNTISVPFIVYRIVYRNGVYFTIPEQVERTYMLEKTPDDIYYFLFTKAKSDGQFETSDADGLTGRYVSLDDVECNIRADVVVTAAQPTMPDNASASVVGTKTLSGGGKTSADIQAGQFSFTITADASNPAGGAAGIPATAVATAAGGALNFGTWTFSKTGTYRFTVSENTPPANYSKGADVLVTVEVSQSPTGGGLQAAVTYSSGNTLTIANTYTGSTSSGDDDTWATAALLKVDSKDAATTLSGAKFELHRVTGSRDTLVGTYTTNASGKITANRLSAGEYYWVEIGAPEGYTLDSSKHSFTLSSSGSKTVTVTNERTNVPEWLNGLDHYAYIIGYTDGNVHPEANITRAEVATIFFRLLTDEVKSQNMTTSNSFSDVNEGMWCNRAISTMAAMGIVNGYSDGTFKPQGKITRAEFAAIAARFDTNGNSTGASFTDIYGHWAQKEIGIAANNGWILGYSDGTFKPDQLITRAEAMTMVNRVLQRVPEFTTDLLDNMVKWPDNTDTKKWYYLAVQEATNSHDFNRKTNGYESWTNLRPVRDWTEFEK